MIKLVGEAGFQSFVFQIGARYVPVSYPVLKDYEQICKAMEQTRQCFAGHVRRVEQASELTKHLPDSQFKRAEAVLKKIQDAGQNYLEAVEALQEYRLFDNSSKIAI